MIQNIKIKKTNRNKFSEALLTASNIVGRMPLNLSSGLDEAFSQSTAKNKDAIIILLENKCAFAKQVANKNKSPIGKIFNKIGLNACSCVEIDGIILEKIIELTKEKVAVEINCNKSYELSLEEVEKIINKLKKES